MMLLKLPPRGTMAVSDRGDAIDGPRSVYGKCLGSLPRLGRTRNRSRSLRWLDWCTWSHSRRPGLHHWRRKPPSRFPKQRFL